jgi:Tol biopolymer transport system component
MTRSWGINLQKFLALVLVLVACGTLQPTPSNPLNSASRSGAGSSTAVESTRPSATAFSVAGVEAFAAGTLKGDFALVLQRTSDGQFEKQEVWLVAIDGSRSTLIARYTPSSGGPINMLGSISRSLTRSLSPNGQQLLVSAQLAGSQSLVAITLATGATASVGADPTYIDIEASWPPTGTTLAISRARAADPSKRELWIGNIDGSGWRRLLGGPISTLYGFTPDGTSVCFAVVKISCVSSATGVETATYEGQASSDIAEKSGSAQRSVLRVLALDPRWRPSSDEILYRTDTQIFVTSIAGQSRRLPTEKVVRRAEWTAQGTEVVFIAAESAFTPNPPAPPPATTLRAIHADGTGERELFKPAFDGHALGLFELALMRY